MGSSYLTVISKQGWGQMRRISAPNGSHVSGALPATDVCSCEKYFLQSDP